MNGFSEAFLFPPSSSKVLLLNKLLFSRRGALPFLHQMKISTPQILVHADGHADKTNLYLNSSASNELQIWLHWGLDTGGRIGGSHLIVFRAMLMAKLLMSDKGLLSTKLSQLVMAVNTALQTGCWKSKKEIYLANGFLLEGWLKTVLEARFISVTLPAAGSTSIGSCPPSSSGLSFSDASVIAACTSFT